MSLKHSYSLILPPPPSKNLALQRFSGFNNKKNAFTLAEILISLMILGIIASMTIPALITKYQKKQTCVKLERIYSTLSQAVKFAEANNGPMSSWEVGNAKNANDCKKFLEKYVTPYLRISKKPTTSSEGKWNNTVYYMNGNVYTYPSSHVRFYLNDGSSMTAYIHSSNNTSKRVIIDIDINGDNKPNKFGRDIFSLSYPVVLTDYPHLAGKLMPAGFNIDFPLTRDELLSERTENRCNKNKNGGHCFGLIILDGWKIADDYPW